MGDHLTLGREAMRFHGHNHAERYAVVAALHVAEGEPVQPAGGSWPPAHQTTPAAGSAQLCLNSPLIGALELHTLGWAPDFSWRPARRFGQDNQQGQDGCRPANRGEEHQADCH